MNKKALILMLFLTTCNHKTEETEVNSPFIEGFPDYLIQANRNFDNQISQLLILSNLSTNLTKAGKRLIQSIISNDDKIRWKNNSTITVGFNGGSLETRDFIVNTANEWTEYGNIRFDFGNNQRTHNYRGWSSSDISYSSEIRIGFNEKSNFSVLGKNAINPTIAKCYQPSMNFSDLDLNFPNNSRRKILHEFGHALGFHHENQRSQEECGIDEKKAYEYYHKYYNWGRLQTTFNIITLPSLTGIPLSSYDTESIMHYDLPWTILLKGKGSKCYINKINYKLSEKDKIGMGKAYPK